MPIAPSVAGRPSSRPFAHVKGVADISLREGDVDVTESFGQATDFGKRRLAGTGSRRRVRLVRGVDETAGKANGKSAEVRKRRAFIGILQYFRASPLAVDAP